MIIFFLRKCKTLFLVLHEYFYFFKFLKYFFLFINFINIKRKQKDINKFSQTIILIEYYKYYPSILAFFFFTKILSKKFNSKIYALDFSNKSIVKRLFCFVNPFYYLYRSLGVKKFFFQDDCVLDINSKTFKEVYKNIKSKKDIINIQIKNIKVGEFLYDEYLKSHNKITIKFESIEFRLFLLSTINRFLYWHKFFSQNKKKIQSLVLSHSVYFLGMISSLAVSMKIPVYIVSNTNCCYLSKKHIRKDSGYNNYLKIFNSFSKSDQFKYLRLSMEILKSRFKGNVDIKSSHNKLSDNPYGPQKSLKRCTANTSKIKILIATHCFTDAIHVYGKNLFVDFYEWIDHLGKISEKTDYLWYIKIHPLDYDKNLKYLKNFSVKYKKLQILNKNINHTQLIREKIDVVLTVYGVIGHEYPLFGIPVVNASNSGPHNSYNFNYNPKKINEYNKILFNLKKIKKLKVRKIDKKNIYKFFYLYGLTDYSLVNNLNIVKKNLGKLYNTPAFYKYYLDNYDNSRFNKIEKDLEKFISSKKFRIIANNSGEFTKIINYI